MHTVARLDLRQQTALSPRLQHAVRLLQLSSLDFAQEIQGALARNPFLEQDEAEPDPTEAADPLPLAEGTVQREPPADELDAMDRGGDGADVADRDDASDGSDAASPADNDYDGERDTWLADGSVSNSRGDDKQISALDLTPADSTLKAHLHAQLSVMPLPLRDLLLAKAVVESLDDDGYLRDPLDDLLEGTGLDPAPNADELRIALCRVQSLEPAGVGARNVAECVLLQLAQIDCAEQRETARRMVSDHLDSLAAKDVTRLARLLDRPVAHIEGVCERIRRLNPRPGWRYGSSQVHYVIPDVVVKKVRREWTVSLNPAIVPRVRMNHMYADMFQRHRSGHDEMAAHLQEARWTVRNVEQRFSTILSVAEAIVKRQSRFFELGALAMRPLGLREIADEVGLHESTVSRVTNNKYMSTPVGVFELKYFFSRAMTATNGGTYSGTAIRGVIKDMIAAERPALPLSDAQIARRLAQQGFVVARRTVTKYRQQLRIESVERRRVHA